WRVGRRAPGRLHLWRRQPGTPLSPPYEGGVRGGAPYEGGARGAVGQTPSVNHQRTLTANNRSCWWTDWLMTRVLGASLLCSLGPLFLILGYLTYRGIGSLDWDFFTQVPVPPGEPGGGLAHAIYGSALLVGLASLFAVPVGILGAVYLSEYRTHAFV